MKKVTFTHQSAEAYAAIELTGLYLYAARILNAKLLPRREQIATLVDFGCGAGKSTRSVAGCVKARGSIVGVDVSDEMLAQARRLTEAAASQLADTRFEFRRIVDGRLPLRDGEADAIVTCAVLQEIQTEAQLGEVLAEIGRVAKKGAHFVAVVPNEHLRSEDFVSLTYAPYPENRTRQDNIRQCRSNEAPIVWESDRHWSKETYGKLLGEGGWEVLTFEYPLADPAAPPYPKQPQIPWKDELRVSPALVIHARKR